MTDHRGSLQAKATGAKSPAMRSRAAGRPSRSVAPSVSGPAPKESGRAGRLQQFLAEAAPRDVDGGAYLQDFLVATVVTILLTRLFLGLTGFPRLGGGGLHVAHLLWG